MKNPDPEYGIVPLHEVEREEIAHAIEATGWDIDLAAEKLGIGRTTLYRKLHKYGYALPPRERKSAK